MKLEVEESEKQRDDDKGIECQVENIYQSVASRTV